MFEDETSTTDCTLAQMGFQRLEDRGFIAFFQEFSSLIRLVDLMTAFSSTLPRDCHPLKSRADVQGNSVDSNAEGGGVGGDG